MTITEFPGGINFDIRCARARVNSIFQFLSETVYICGNVPHVQFSAYTHYYHDFLCGQRVHMRARFSIYFHTREGKRQFRNKRNFLILADSRVSAAYTFVCVWLRTNEVLSFENATLPFEPTSLKSPLNITWALSWHEYNSKIVCVLSTVAHLE